MGWPEACRTEPESPDCALPFQFPRGHSKRPLFLSGLTKAAWSPSFPWISIFWWILQADWNELKVAGGLVRKCERQRENKGLLEPNRYLWKSWPWLPKETIDGLEEFFPLQIRGSQKNRLPWDPRGPHTSPWCWSVVSGVGFLEPSTIVSLFGQTLHLPERSRNKDQSPRNLQALGAPLVFFFFFNF